MNVSAMHKIQGGIFLYKKIIFGLFLTIAFFLIRSDLAKAVGVAPGTITINNVINGITIPKKVRVTRPTTAGSLTFKVEAQGEAGQYISLSNKSITILPGKNYIDFDFTINPKTASNGPHKAFLVFTTTDGNVGGSQFGVTTYEGATAEIEFTVTDTQVNVISIGGLVTEPIESINSPTFTFNIINEGTVDSKPDEIQVTITDKSRSVLLQESIPKEFFPLVPPGQTQSVTVSTTKKLPPGNYYLNTKFIQDGKKIFEKNDVYFSIAPEGTLSQDGEIKSITVSPPEGAVGTLLKIDGIFSNTGSIGTRPKFFVNVTRDTKIIETLQSTQEYVGVKKEGKFSVTFRPDTVGKYEFNGYFTFGVRETARKKTNANITSLASNLKIASWLRGCSSNSIIVSLLMFAICMTVLFIHYFRLWQKHKRCICPYGCECHGGNKERPDAPSNINAKTDDFHEQHTTDSFKGIISTTNSYSGKNIDDEIYS